MRRRYDADSNTSGALLIGSVSTAQGPHLAIAMSNGVWCRAVKQSIQQEQPTTLVARNPPKSVLNRKLVKIYSKVIEHLPQYNL